jgi:glycosyltransferase involved in cell wall biosynthesis
VNYLFYDDSPVFGGHEVMTLLGIEALLSEPGVSVRFLASVHNSVLLEKLKGIAARYPSLQVEPIQARSSKLEGLKNRLPGGRLSQLADRLAACRPSLVVAVQGNIEHSSLALLAARRAGIPVASYIPVPHSHVEMGAKFGALRDLTTPYLFKLPDRFITISHEMARRLRGRGADCPIDIVYNGVDVTRFQPLEKASARAALGVPEDGILLGLVGRIEFKQKQQDLLLQALKSQPGLAERFRVVFAGDGPDREALLAMASEPPFKGRVTVLPWVDTAQLYPALDVLVIPSRYEGLPLVMLEALACGTAVLGSNRDGMKDILPESWRFPPDSSAALGSHLQQLGIQQELSPPAKLVERIRDEMSLPAFSDSFRKTLKSMAASGNRADPL